MHKRRQWRGRRAAAFVVCACAQAAWAGTPGFSSGTVTISHDIDVNDASTASGLYKKVNVTPPLTAPASYQLDTYTSSSNWLKKTVGVNTGTSTATATVLRVENGTNTGITLAAGTGVAQKDPGHILGDSVLHFDINDLRWTPNTTFGPPGYGYVSVIVGGSVNGTAAFSGNLTYTDQYNNPLRSAAVLGPATYTSSGSLPQAFTSQIKFTPSSVTATTQIRINGDIEFRANNGIDDTSSSPIAVEVSGAPPTATWYNNSTGFWSDPGSWQAPANAVIDDPDHSIPTIPNGVDQRARFVTAGQLFDQDPGLPVFGPVEALSLDIPVVLGTLDIDGPTGHQFSLNGPGVLTLQTSGQDLNPAVISHRGAQGNSHAEIGVPIVLNSPLQLSEYSTGGMELNGPVSGGQNIQKDGPGEVDIHQVSGNNLVINEGVVGLGNATFSAITVGPKGSLSMGFGGVNSNVKGPILNNGVMIIQGGPTAPVDNPIGGNGSLIKTDTGIASLTGNMTYTGPTTVNGGELIVLTNLSSPRFNVNDTGTLKVSVPNAFTAPNTHIDLAAGGVLDVSSFNPFITTSNLTITGNGGTVVGNVSHAAGNIDPGGPLAAGTVNINGNLALNGGNLNFDLGPVNDLGNGVNDLIGVSGNLALNSGNVIVDFTSGLSSPGNYHLITYGGSLSGSTSNLNLVNNSRANVELTQAGPGVIDLQVNSIGLPAILNWTGTGPGGGWDLNNAVNWRNGATPDKFYTGDVVTFDDSGTQPTVNLVGNLRPSAIIVFSSSVNYTFAGSGKIVGPTGLQKGSDSVLSIPGAHAYTGVTSITGGVLAADILADGGVESSVGASSNDAANLLLNGGTLRYTGSGASTDRLFSVGLLGGAIDAAGSGAINFTNAGPIGSNSETGPRTLTLTGDSIERNTISASIADNGGPTSLSKTGPGRWIITGNNTYTGPTAVNAGALVINGSHVGGGEYTVASGAQLSGDGQTDAHVTVNPNGIIAPGDDGVGFLSVGGLALNNATYDADVDFNGADLLAINGAAGLTLSSSTIVLNNLGGAKPGVYTLLDYDGAALANLSQLTLSSPTLGSFNVSLINDTANTSVDLQILSQTGGWNVANGNWSTAGSWIGPVPHLADEVANFTGSAAPRSVSVDAPQTVGIINLNETGAVTIGGSGLLTMDAAGDGVAINVMQGSHTIAAPLFLNMATTVNVVPAASLLDFTGSVDSDNAYIVKTGLGTAQFKKVDVAGLVVYDGQVHFSAKPIANQADGTSVIRALDISAGAAIDMANNSMVIDYPDEPVDAGPILQDLRNFMSDSRMISSLNTATLRLGYADNTQLGSYTVFSGVPVDESSVLIKQTFAGDLNLDDMVDLSDLTTFAAHWLQTDQYWQFGDLNYDGIVNEQDLRFFLFTWQDGVGSPSGQSIYDAVVQVGLPLSAIPEPASLGAIAGFAWSLKRSRRRK